MSCIEPRVFGGARCAWVASHLRGLNEGCWIFSICSDERIPDAFEMQARGAGPNNVPSRLIILGDFPHASPPLSPASFEAIRLLASAAGYRGTIQVSWLDGESIDTSSTLAPELVWHEFDLGMQRRPVSVRPWVVPTCSMECMIVDDMTHLLGRRPDIRLSDDGHIDAIFFVDVEPYRRSLLGGLSNDEQTELWRQIVRLKYLVEIRAGFSGLIGIPNLSGLSRLGILDLRGNPGIRLDNLRSAVSLRKLNIAACALSEVPPGLSDLKYLQTLMLHKNFIGDVSSVSFPPALQRLSLYRNRIVSGTLDMSPCQQISEINIGANPVQSLAVRLPEAVSNVSLGLRYIKSPVSLLFART